MADPAALSLTSEASEEGWLVIVPFGGGVTCTVVGDGGTTVSLNGSAAEPGTGRVSILANMAKNVRLAASPHRIHVHEMRGTPIL